MIKMQSNKIEIFNFFNISLKDILKYDEIVIDGDAELIVCIKNGD